MPQEKRRKEWWANFYHVLDPISGALSDKTICGEVPPSNFHIKSGWFAFIAHLAYWRDTETLRFILGRVYGKDFLKDREFKPWPGWVQLSIAIVTYFFWAHHPLPA